MQSLHLGDDLKWEIAFSLQWIKSLKFKAGSVLQQ